MNLFFKSYHFYLFFFITFWLKTPLLLGIGQSANISATLETIPFNIPAAYNQSPTISFCRSEQGITYISKNNHLVVIDDDKVYTHPINSTIHLSCSHHQKPAFLNKNDLGFISYSPFTGTSFESKLANTSITKTFQPVNIAHNRTHTFFATSIGIYTIGSDSLQFHSFQSNPCKVFTAGAETFAHVFSLGIYRWNGTGFDKVIDQTALKLSEINSITDWDNGWVVASENQQVFFKETVNGYTQRKLPPPFKNNRINHFRKLNDHTLIYFDQGESIKIFNSKRQCTQSFHTNITLPKSHPVDIFTDQFHDLWLVYDYSVYKLNPPGNSLSMNLSARVPNFIYSAGIQSGTIYLGTFDGLFKVELKPNCQCTLHSPNNNTETSMHLIAGSESAIFTAGKNGLYSLKGAEFQKIRSGSFSFLKLINDNQIVARIGNTLFQLTKTKEQKWRVADSLENVSQISSFTKHSDELWLLTQEDMLISNGPDGLIKHSIDCSNILGEKKLLSYQQALLITNEGRLMKIRTETGDIKTAEDIPNAEYLIQSALLKKTSNHYWIAKNEPGGGYLIYDLQNLQEGAPFFNITTNNQFGQLVNIFETKKFIWLIGSQKIVRLLKSPEESTPSKTLRIQSVRDADHQKVSESSRINYKNNHLYFNLGDIRYKNNPQPYYRYRISHYQEKWSDWSSEKTIEFTDLKERKYTFTAQSISHIGHLSDPVSFSFSIAPPFYRTWIAYIIYLLLLLILAFLLYKFHLMNLQRVENRLEEKIRLRLEPVLAEKEKSDKLVEDLLPKTTADELKTSGRAKSKKFELVTVLFSDIQGFTRIAEEMNPEILIDELDKFFFHFDSVVEKYNIEKIKTIGDAYMAAGGIPIKNSSNPVEVVLAGLEMQNYMKELKKQKADIWDLRIGIHTGPVITGVVGHKKLSYDIWGDTVNTASRMESSGEGGKVNISGITYS
ncbi:MAG TPA: adenylate/guanylate cyclase domain-containing protein, partial [Bacteroidales bacterium]|nr:adenylate/guanylate cyclase domain-containing protein [Bacteroidales bacterium]